MNKDIRTFANSGRIKARLALSSAQLHTQTTQRPGAVIICFIAVLSRQWTCARRYGR